MKGSKKLLLLASLLVGFGFAGSSNAATIQSVAVASPDSGVVRGIDSTFQVTVDVVDFTQNDDMKAYIYLIVGGVDSSIVAGGGAATSVTDTLIAATGRTLLNGSSS